MIQRDNVLKDDSNVGGAIQAHHMLLHRWEKEPMDFDEVSFPGSIDDLVEISKNEILYYSDSLDSELINVYRNDSYLAYRQICRSTRYPFLGLFLRFDVKHLDTKYLVHIRYLSYIYKWNKDGEYSRNYRVLERKRKEELSFSDGLDKTRQQLQATMASQINDFVPNLLRPPVNLNMMILNEERKDDLVSHRSQPLGTNQFLTSSNDKEKIDLQSEVKPLSSDTYQKKYDDSIMVDDEETNTGETDEALAKKLQDEEYNSVSISSSSLSDERKKFIQKEFFNLKKSIGNWKSDCSYGKFHFLYTHASTGELRPYVTMLQDQKGRLDILKAHERTFMVHELFLLFHSHQVSYLEYNMRKEILSFLTEVLKNKLDYHFPTAQLLLGKSPICRFMFQSLPKSVQVSYLVTFLYHFSTWAFIKNDEYGSMFEPFNLLSENCKFKLYLEHSILPTKLNVNALKTNTNLFINMTVLDLTELTQ